MSIPTQADQVAALAAHRAALDSADRRQRAARLAQARRQEEARFTAANRLAALFGQLLRRWPPAIAPTPPTLLHNSRMTERRQKRRDAA